MSRSTHNINLPRMLSRLAELAEIGTEPGGGTTRLALTDSDKAGRDLVVRWMTEAGLQVRIDEVGNIFATRPGKKSVAPVMTGSHIDSVISAGPYDGCYGVLAAIETCLTLDDNETLTDRPITVAVFSNEEGVRFQPDMMGSLAFVGGLNIADVYETIGTDGRRFGSELQRIGYLGDSAQVVAPHAFIELHIEQGPVLEANDSIIGVVENLQGISWQEVTLTGQANHAGTTPMHLRQDAGYCAAALTTWLHDYAEHEGNQQVATVGCVELRPGAINIVPGGARITVDLRNPDEARLRTAEIAFGNYLKELTTRTGISYERRQLARFEPIAFDPKIVQQIERVSENRGLSNERMTSGAGHDAQMLARICPSAMIFVPSIGGISHNPAEDTAPEHLEAGANVLMDCLVNLATDHNE